ncbi:type 1 glutamine amidotransferase [Nostocoides sp. Soil756]|jgi:GMP synthase (glutamine-hydrolysing)|uniref:type 1 glutamine amidotransferase n=1 Tax=Nostocoides sp. Soil756 TaxID=1736399 RepID=UPI0006FB1D88|nr:type 1 glutamine amidotransferase [Tetrasphaera sp. Soil756]KRE61137.1 GMP synthase [Tetrasphaera sp. Soil756]
MGARLLVVQHEPDAPAGWLGEWWAAAGVELDVVRADLGQPLPARLSDGGHDGLVVLGGAMGANDDALHPWLRPTKELLRDTVRGGSPTLGVCLGHQLASVGLGGAAGPNPHGRTVGVVPVALTPEGADDPLLAGLDGAGAVHFNDDVVGTPPPGATVLARLPDGSAQALRLGERAWSVQFHPETSPEIFGAWLRWERPDGLEPADEALLATVTAARDRLRGTWETFATRFAAQLG